MPAKLIWRRSILILGVATLFATSPVAGDLFTWNPQASATWSDPDNWTGTAGQFPNGSDDIVVIAGATAWDPEVDFTYQLGSLWLEENGDLKTGNGTNNNNLLVVTGVGGYTGATHIRDNGSQLTVYRSSNAKDLDTDDLFISDGGKIRLYDGANVEVDDALILTGGIIQGEGTFELTRNDGTNDPDNNGRILANGGELRFYGHEDVVFDADGSDEDGSLEIGQWSTLIFDVQVESQFNGTIELQTGAELVMSNTWTLGSDAGSSITCNAPSGGRGTLTGPGGSINGHLDVQAGKIRLQGAFSIGSTATVTTNPGTVISFADSTFLANGASYTGDGVIHILEGATAEIDHGAVVTLPFVNHGHLEFDPNDGASGTVMTYEQSAAGRLDIGVCSMEPDGFNQLQVLGEASLAGRLHLSDINGCEPENGDTFVVLTAAAITGSFDEITGLPGATVGYDATSVTVSFGVEPCPADLDDDGFVGIADLLALLGAWGGPDTDLTGDGTTDVQDLLNLLGAWGVC